MRMGSESEVTSLQATMRWLLEWIGEHGRMPDLPHEKLLTANYVDGGWIDSFTIISLIEESEAKFSMRYSQDNFQDPRFMTIRGLAEIIGEIKESCS